jgi:hypothetical protein
MSAVMFERRYLESADVELFDQLIYLADKKWGATEGFWLVAVLDGAREYFDAIRSRLGNDTALAHAARKEKEFFQMCRRIVRSANGRLLIDPQSNGSVYLDWRKQAIVKPNDALIARFPGGDLLSVLSVALEIRNRLVEYNLTTDCGLKWEEQFHPRISVGGHLASAFAALRSVWRGEIYCLRDDWESSLDAQVRRLLISAGVKPAPTQAAFDEIEKFLENLAELVLEHQT